MSSAQKQPASPRKDPEYRIADFEDAFSVVGEDPAKKYLWVPKAAPAGHGPDYYENVRQYQVEEWREGGVRPACLKFKAERDGQPIEVADHVLMSIPRKVDKARWQAGQDKVSKIENSIIRRRGQHDPMRGIGKLVGETFRDDRYVTHKNEIEPLTQHIGES